MIFSIYKDQFDFIDFGSVANSFLRNCGVKDEPSPIELALQVVQTPEKFLERGHEVYLSILRQMGAQYPLLKQNQNLIYEMKKSKFLIGLAQDETSKTDILIYRLGLANEIYLIDDTVIKQIFNPLW